MKHKSMSEMNRERELLKAKKEADEEQKNCTCGIGRYSSL